MEMRLILIFTLIIFGIHSNAQVKVLGNYDNNFNYEAKPLRKIMGPRWQYTTAGMGSFMPLVHNGVVYSGDSNGNLYAIDIKSGKEFGFSMLKAGCSTVQASRMDHFISGHLGDYLFTECWHRERAMENSHWR